MVFEIPIPSTLEEVLWFGVGLVFARAFGKKLDYEIQQTAWFKNLKSPLAVHLVKALLDALHHWYIGLAVVVYAGRIAGVLSIPSLIPFWLGCGVFVDDLPDLPNRIKRYFRVE